MGMIKKQVVVLEETIWEITFEWWWNNYKVLLKIGNFYQSNEVVWREDFWTAKREKFIRALPIRFYHATVAIDGFKYLFEMKLEESHAFINAHESRLK